MVLSVSTAPLLAVLGRTRGPCPHCGGTSLRRHAAVATKAIRTVGQVVFLAAYGFQALLMALLFLFFPAEGAGAVTSWGTFALQEAVLIAALLASALLTRP